MIPDYNIVKESKELLYNNSYNYIFKCIEERIKFHNKLADSYFRVGNLNEHSAHCGVANEMLKLLSVYKNINDIMNGNSLVISKKEFMKYKKIDK